MAETIELGIVGIKNCGEYNAETNYEKLNVVTYQGSSYCALKDTVGNLPTDTEYWQLYAEKGAKGDTGATGNTGPVGPVGPVGPKGDPGGTPLVASNISEMADTTKVYVNTTDGHWYYYNGSAWVDGGVYQASQLEADSINSYYLNNIKYYSLSDSAKKGSSGHDVKEEIELQFEQGLRHNNGILENSANTVITKNKIKIETGTEILLSDLNYKIYIFYIDENNTPHTLIPFSSNSFLFSMDSLHSDKEYYIEIRKNDNSNITPVDVVGLLTLKRIITSVKNDYISLSPDIQKLFNNSISFNPNGLYLYGNTLAAMPGFYYPASRDPENDSNVNRFFMSNPIYLPKGTIVKTSKDYRFILTLASTKELSTKIYYPSSSYTKEYTVEQGDIYYLQCKKTDNSNVYSAINDFVENTIITIPAHPAQNSNKIMYVSENGNDVTGNGSSSKPYRQISTALQNGADTVLCEIGTYAPFSISRNNIKIVGAQDTFSSNNAKQNYATIDLSEDLTFTQNNGLLECNYNALQNSSMYKCFISQERDFEDGTSTRSKGYYATIFSDGDINSSHRYHPVETLTLCINEKGTFFYDGTKIVLNPFDDNDYSFNYSLVDYDLINNSYLCRVQANNILFENIAFKHTSNRLLYCDNSSDVTCENCVFMGSSMSDNLAVLNSNINIRNCISYLARNDGYNFHGFGTSQILNCIGANCFDDGISHHDACKCSIVGGEWFGNNKGGISTPTYGAEATITGCYIHDNVTYGILSASDSSMCKLYASNNLIVNNNTGVFASYTNGCLFNNKYQNNTTNKTITSTSNIVDAD